VVDDDPAMRGLVSALLRPEGYGVSTAADAAEARAAAARERFDLALCDIDMPGESGIDLIAHMAARQPETGIVMVTVITEPSVAAAAIAAGIYGYVVKPFDKYQVRITVANALRLRALDLRERERRCLLERQVQQRTAALLETQEILRRHEHSLQRSSAELAQLHGALALLLEKRQADRAELEERMLASARQVTRPHLDRLRGSRLDPRQRELLELLAASIEALLSPFVKALTSSYLRLTPAELQVADLIRQGRQTKEIAHLLGLLPNTVMTHRFHLRRKLGLLNTSQNLGTYLRTLG
jgi:DNA-binding NarL/FixJ family response regulator